MVASTGVWTQVWESHPRLEAPGVLRSYQLSYHYQQVEDKSELWGRHRFWGRPKIQDHIEATN